MPSNKDFKRRVRERMRKTGESYTTARAHLLRKSKQSATSHPSADRYAVRAGMRNAAVDAKTGRTWEGWVRALDEVEAYTWTHREIARHVRERYGLSGWWSQTVTVGYERIKGLRAIGQRRDGGFDVNKSKTLPVPVRQLYRAVRDERLRARWIEGASPVIRGAQRNKSVRMVWNDGTPVEVHFTVKSRGKSVVQVQHRKLPTKEVQMRVRREWGERLDALARLLAET